MSNNRIPNLRASGKFVAAAPFDGVVKESTFYTVEAIRTIPEMQALKLDLFKTVWQPAGYTEVDYQSELETAIADKAAIISLTSRGQGPVYVPSTFLKSFPMVDGVVYERLALITDLGSCPPNMKDRVNNAIDHFNNYIKSTFGIQDANTTLGTIPTRSYVSRQTATDWEASRQLQITAEPSDAVRINMLEAKVLQQAAYIQQLEAAVAAKTTG